MTEGEIDIHSLDHRLEVIDAMKGVETLVSQKRRKLRGPAHDLLIDTAMRSSELVGRGSDPEEVRTALHTAGAALGAIVGRSIYGLKNWEIARFSGVSEDVIRNRVSKAARYDAWVAGVLGVDGSSEDKKRHKRQEILKAYRLGEMHEVVDNREAFFAVTALPEGRQAFRSLPFDHKGMILSYLSSTEQAVRYPEAQQVTALNVSWRATRDGMDFLKHRTASPLLRFYGVDTEDTEFSDIRDRIADRFGEEGHKDLMVWAARLPRHDQDLFREYWADHTGAAAEKPELKQAFLRIDDQRRGLLLAGERELNDIERHVSQRLLRDEVEGHTKLTPSDRRMLVGLITGVSHAIVGVLGKPPRPAEEVEARHRELIDPID